MKIGLVLPELPQYSETFFSYKIKGLLENGHEVMVFTSGEKKIIDDPGYEVRYSPKVHSGRLIMQAINFPAVLAKTLLTSLNGVRKFFMLERNDGKSFMQAVKSVFLNSHIISEHPDWLHFGFATTALNRENAAAAIGARMSVSFRGFDINIYPLKHPGCYDLLWKKLDKVHTISGYLHDKAVKMGLPANISYSKITPAIDTKKFRPVIGKGKFHKPLRILTVGRLNWIKDYETAVSALGILKSRGVDFTYEIIGDGKELERIRFAAYQSGIDELVTFRGRLSHEETANRMRESDIYLQTSMQEGFCVSVLEAQATGLICVVSDADGLRENVIDGVTGIIAKRRCPVHFADMIERAMKMSEEEKIRMSESAKARVESEYGIEKQNELFNEFFLK